MGTAMLVAIIAAVALANAATTGAETTASLSARSEDPVVLLGSSVPGLSGVLPSRVVAFRYAGAWQQVPVQVDERAARDLGIVYNSAPVGVVVTVYTDSTTWTGPDANQFVDADDEIVVMAKDAGALAPAGSPAGTVGSRTRLTITDPISNSVGYVYLFAQNGSLRQDAGRPYVRYDFRLLSGAYKPTYKLSKGPNPEDSTVTTAAYVRHFSDRWIDDVLQNRLGSGVDILDRHKFLFAPDDCLRSEDTFSSGRGAFIANITGPVRAIRSLLGANSGPLTQRDHLFYERRHDIRTFMRVHAVVGGMDFFDYSPAASGMRYRNNLNTDGVVVDGARDAVVTGTLSWESVSGTQGSVTIVHTGETNIPSLTPSSYYLDTTSPTSRERQCTGDRWAYGASGPWINTPIPSTDPTTGSSFFLRRFRSLYFDAPGVTAVQSAARVSQVSQPLRVVAAAD
ncbi:MAG: hypothetical protein ACKOAZ_11105 [Ilumatobacteraceae bacterium]